jgi:hypothetical protein
LKQARSYLNRKHWKLRPRGRGPRRSQGANKQFLALPLATYFGVYIWSPTGDAIARAEWDTLQKQLNQLRREANQPAQKVEKFERLIKLFYRKRAIDLVN